MIIQSKIPVLFPLKEPELPVKAVSENGTINKVEVTVEGITLSFNRDANGNFTSYERNGVEPAFIAYIGRQLSRRFN